MEARIKNKYILLILFTLIFIFSIYLRLQGAFSGTFAYTYDIGRDLLSVQKVINTHSTSLIGSTTGQPGIFYGPWWYWILLLPFLIANGEPKGIDVFMGISGILTILVGYYLGKKINNVWLGILLSAFLCFSPLLIGISTQIWNPNLAPLATILLAFLLIQIIETKQSKSTFFYFLCLGLLAALSFDSLEIVYGSIQLIALLLFLFIFLRKKLLFQAFFAFLFGLVIIEIPRIVFEMRHHFLMTHVLVSSLFSSKNAGNNMNMIVQLPHVLVLLWEQWRDTFFTQDVVSLSILILTVIGGMYLWKRNNFSSKEKLLVMFFTTYVLTYAIVLLFFSGNIWSHFVVGMPIIFVLLFVIILYRLLALWKRNNKIFFQTAIWIIIIFFLARTIQIFTVNNSKLMNDPSVYNNQVGVIQYIYKHADHKPFDYDVYTPPIIPYTYQYLFTLYSKKYFPPNQHARLVFYIIEPDFSHPTLRSDWIVKHDKNTLEIAEKALPGNIVVQTRKR